MVKSARQCHRATKRKSSSLPASAPRLTAAADSIPCARCSSRRGRQALPAVARHRGRAAPDGRPRALRVARHAARGASPDSASHGGRHGPRPSASPAVARPTSAGSGGRESSGSGWRSPDGRSGRSAARSSWASRRRRCGGRSPGRRRPVSEPSTIRQPRAMARRGSATSVHSVARRWLGRLGPSARAARGGFRRRHRDTARRTGEYGGPRARDPWPAAVPTSGAGALEPLSAQPPAVVVASSVSGTQPVASLDHAPVPAPDTSDAPPATDASSRARPAYPSLARASGSVARSQQAAQMRMEARLLPLRPR